MVGISLRKPLFVLIRSHIDKIEALLLLFVCYSYISVTMFSLVPLQFGKNKTNCAAQLVILYSDLL